MDRKLKKAVVDYITKNITTFHEKRVESISQIKLNTILKRKNPYLYKAKNVTTAGEFVKSIVDAFLSSQEETIFGDFLEGLARFVCEAVYHGQKSASEGIDLDFCKDDIRYLVSIKSGPNWGNSSQIKKMKDNFKQAKRILSTNQSKINIVAVNGCCYGRDSKADKGDYLKLCGQSFWEFISGNKNMYLEIIEPLGKDAKQKNEVFLEEYSKVINKFTAEFIAEFCADGLIDWDRLVAFNSQA